MHGISICLLGIATNLDNLCIGMAYGCRGQKIALRMNACIALISGLISLVLCLFSSCIAEGLQTLANFIGACLLIAIGIWTLWPKQQKETAVAAQASAWVLGLALAVNCIPAAFGAGLTGLSPIWLGSTCGFQLCDGGPWQQAGLLGQRTMAGAAAGCCFCAMHVGDRRCGNAVVNKKAAYFAAFLV